MITVLQFPSEEQIVAYLKRHSSISAMPWLKNSGIIEAAAKAFANQRRGPAGFRMGISLMIYRLKGIIPDNLTLQVTQVFTEALLDCAEASV